MPVRTTHDVDGAGNVVISGVLPSRPAADRLSGHQDRNGSPTGHEGPGIRSLVGPEPPDDPVRTEYRRCTLCT